MEVTVEQVLLAMEKGAGIPRATTDFFEFAEVDGPPYRHIVAACIFGQAAIALSLNADKIYELFEIYDERLGIGDHCLADHLVKLNENQQMSFADIVHSLTVPQDLLEISENIWTSVYAVATPEEVHAESENTGDQLGEPETETQTESESETKNTA